MWAKTESVMSGLSGFLVKWRNLLLIVTVALAAVCAVLIPKVNVNADMSLYLPDNSPMKQGMKQMSESLPLLDQHMRLLSVMLTDADLRPDAPAVLDSLTGHLKLDSVREKDNLTLYRFNITSETDTEAVEERILEHYGDKAVVEVDGENLVMGGIGTTIFTGFVLIFIVLIIMCRSLMEVLLFLVTTGIAVLLNMGTNYFLGTVSLSTHSLVALLQMVLSMDYSIIIMNRYREEKTRYDSHPQAMAAAIRLSARTILSSALTTFVGLVMLVFLRLKIGADLGWVISKGVALSLLCNFTVLPALIIAFDKAIEKTGKRTPTFPVAPIARFERAFRWPLTILFVAIFVAAAILHRKTEINFSAVWPTTITTEFPPDNPVMVLYSTADESAVPDFLDSLSTNPKVLSSVSYPSLSLKKLTSAEMAERFQSLSPLITEDLLDIVYYAKAHPERTERLRLSQLEKSAEMLADAGLIEPIALPDLNALPKAPEPVSAPEPEPEAEPEMPEAAVPANDSVAVAVPAAADTTAVETEPDPEAQGFTYEDATTPLTAEQVATLVGTDRRLISMVYRMAGEKGRDAKMEPYRLVRFVREKVLTDKRFSKMIPKEDAGRIHEMGVQLDSVVAAGPLRLPVDTLLADVRAPMLPDTADVPRKPEFIPPVEEPAAEEPVAAEPEPYIPTPLEELAEMAFTDGKYSSAKMQKVLSGAGVKVSREEMDMLYLYTAARLNTDKSFTMSVGEILDFVYGEMMGNPAYGKIVTPEMEEQVLKAREAFDSGVGMLRGDDYSLSLILTSLEAESQEAYDFLDRAEALADQMFDGPRYFIGESCMYKEMKEGFPQELLLLTALTVIAIYIIVALTFKSLLIPIILLITVLSGVYVNVYASGAGGSPMLYISYLIIQGVLMGATIDYSILFTNYYRHCRTIMGVRKSLAVTYYRTFNSILTSGLILIIVPLVMSYTTKDQLTGSIFHSLAMGALAVIFLILLVMPGVLAALDHLVVPAKGRFTTGNSPKE